VAIPVTPRVDDAVNAPKEVNDVWNVDAPVIPMPPEVTNKAAPCEATPEKLEVDTNVALPWAVNPPDTPRPPAAILTLDENAATPECNVVEPNTAAPETPRPVPTLRFPLTPNPPTIVKAPVVEEVDCVDEINESALTLKEELNTAAPLTVNPPVTPSPPAVIFTLEANVATPDTDNVDEAVNAPTEVKEVWNVEAPVIPIPPAVTNNAAA
jgi:hypothetical protein